MHEALCQYDVLRLQRRHTTQCRQVRSKGLHDLVAEAGFVLGGAHGHAQNAHAIRVNLRRDELSRQASGTEGRLGDRRRVHLALVRAKLILKLRTGQLSVAAEGSHSISRGTGEVCVVAVR